MESTEPVRVAVNIRPLTSHELLSGCTGCITVTPNEPKVHIDGHAFTYDFVFGNSGLPSLKIYGYCVAPLVEALFTGYNSTVLTYGQTASGKTYTMGTNHSGDRTNGGIIQKVMEDVFTRVEATKDLTKTLIRISFIEVYNEEVFDLLASNPSRVPIQIRETASGEITLKGVTEVEVKTKEEMGSYLARGSFSRATGSTNMNSQSSRSHAIFTISLQITTAKHILCAKLRLVDLAGSERATRTGASGRRLIEGNHINRGLLALVNVISILGDERKRKKGVHVPYRDSKLTRLLQDSLGGNSKTVIIACVSPAFANAEETLNTLRYAKRSRNIRNKTVVQPKPSAPSCDADDAMFKECHVLSRSSDSCSQAKPSVPSFGYDAMFKECHVFSGSSDSHSQAKPSEPSFGYDAMFKELTPPESESLPVYDTPVYDEEDVSDAFSELKIRWTSQSASFEDVSSSTSSPSKLSKPAGYDVVFEAIPELARSDECSSSPPSNVSKRNSSQPAVYDDVFEAIPELAKFDECSSSSLSNVSIPNSSPLDDLIGNLVKEPKKTESEQEDKGQNKPVDIIDLTADETEFQEKGPFIDLTADEIEFQEKGPFIDLTADETEFQEKGPFIDLTADETEFQHCSPQEKLGMKLKELEKSLEETEAEIRGNYEEKVHKLQKEKRAMQREIEALKRKIASLSSSATSCCTCSKMSACKTVRCQCSVTSRFCISSCGCSAGKCSNRSREERLVEKIPRL